MTDGPILQTPGEMLAAARGKAGLNLDQLAERTKIPAAMLEAIERDEYHKISGDLYVRSFLRSYATEVGLDPETILDAQSRFSGPRSGPDAASGAQVWTEDEVVVQRVGLPWVRILIAAAVLAVVAVVVVVVIGRGGQSGSADEGNPTPETEAETAQQIDDLGGEDGALAQADSLDPGEGADSAGDQTTGTETAAGAPDKAIAVPEETVPAVVDAGDRAPAEIPAEAEAISLDPTGMRAPFTGEQGVPFAGAAVPDLVLRILSENPLRIEVRSDGQREFVVADWPAAAQEIHALPNEGIEPGRVYGCRDGYVVYWGAMDHFSLRLGAVDGVQVHLDGRRYPLVGLAPGQEVILDRHSVGN